MFLLLIIVALLIPVIFGLRALFSGIWGFIKNPKPPKEYRHDYDKLYNYYYNKEWEVKSAEYNEYQHIPHDLEVISSIDGMNGHEFEYYCADLLRKNGFTEVRVTKGSGDQGVDILANKGEIKYAFQCKNYASALSNKPVQEVNAGKTFYNCHVGVVMTNSTFTPGAKALAEATGVLMWDRAVLQEMIQNANDPMESVL